MRKLAILFFLSILSACEPESSQEINSQISATSFLVSIDENPSVGQVLGSIDASTNEGILNFQLESSTPTGAIAIVSDNGRILVADPTIFDFELRESISGTFTVSNGILELRENFMINIQDVPEG